MLMANGTSNLWQIEAVQDEDDWLCMDIDSLLDILDENPDDSQNGPEDPSSNIVVYSESASHIGVNEHSLPHSDFLDLEASPSFSPDFQGSLTFLPSYHSGPSASKAVGSVGSFEPAGNNVPPIVSPMQCCSDHLSDWVVPVPGHDTPCIEQYGVSRNVSSCSQHETKKTQFEIADGGANFEFIDGADNHQLAEKSGIGHGIYCDSGEDSGKTSGAPDIEEASLLDFGEIPDVLCDTSYDLSMQCPMSMNELFSFSPPMHYVFQDSGFYPVSNNTGLTVNSVKTEPQEHLMQNASLNSALIFEAQGEKAGGVAVKALVDGNSNVGGCYESGKGSNRCLSISGSSDGPGAESTVDMASAHSLPITMSNMSNKKQGARVKDEKSDAPGHSFPRTLSNMSNKMQGVHVKDENSDAPGHSFPCTLLNMSNKKQGVHIKDEKNDAPGHSFPHTLSNMSNKKQVVHIKDEKNDANVAALGTTHQSFEVLDDVSSKLSSSVAEQLYAGKGYLQSLSRNLTSISSEDFMVVKGEKEDLSPSTKRARQFIDIGDNTCRSNNPLAGDCCLDVHASNQPFLQPDTSIKKQLFFTKEERESKFDVYKIMNSFPSNVSHQAVQSNALGNITYVDDDPDICIIEDMSEPARKIQSPVDRKPLVTAQRSSPGAPVYHMGLGGSRFKTNDERVIYRVALQDLSQPKSEAFPPDGTLAVSLLKHQRIALSWMVNKETKNLQCSGGILADDQGLGKTISMIALILKERSPSSSVPTIEMQQNEMEALNLDEDDDAVVDLDKPKQNAESCALTEYGNLTRSRNTSVQAKSRPAAGTLVVCPTSVLRQWSDELHNKVSSKANLSVLVYHGGNRTKDPFELAKYDVVLTTYSIVSMEVPKQPLVDEDDDETKGRSDFPPVGLSSSKKRKYPPSSSKRKGKKGMDSELFESLVRPLAKVRWFRVILDEAQSIKNHRTQVARACCGLRAKRRWCLSGTPIQNAIDDLYSYFRFLKYDPYAAYKSFCSGIKVPIQRSPTTGYKKLQAVLRTVMLRRTKGTLLDGEPIINLPPKTVELKKVDFTTEERDFYCRLEADSRAQFAEYAAAGTVKQNYVNILLMLLRLRQACDHPLLVRGCGSNSEWRSSLEVAKKLPREKQSCLLTCLEASLAICGICSDPPEDAVVTTCEHVYCKQCILEHLSGDDSQCPSTKCKGHLSMSSVFSKATLRLSLCDQPGQEINSDCSGSISSEVVEPCSSSGSFNSSKMEAAEALDSSKIKAAVEVLESISKPRDIILRTGSFPSIGDSASSPGNSLIGFTGDVHKDSNRKGNSMRGEKAIVFSQWTRMLDLLEACLKNSSINYRRLDGTMSVAARDKAVKDFNSLPEVTVMIMSLKAASLGLNMVAACHVLLLDLWWNPTTEDQAIDRAHRIGQTLPVTVLRLTVKDTVEDRILALQQKKREMVSSAFGEDETGSRQTRLTVDDLKYLFQV